MRPGNIETFGEHFGFLGKGAMAPPPTAPQQPTYKDVEVSPGIIYKQDTRCVSTGTRMDIVPCEGPDCDPGEMEEDCVDDPKYVEVMDQIRAQEEEERKLQAELAKLEAEERAAAQASFDTERAARRDKFTQLINAGGGAALEEGFDPMMLGILGLGGLVLLGTTMFVLRKPKPAAPAARKRKRRRR